MLVMNFWELFILNFAVAIPAFVLVALFALFTEPLIRLGKKLFCKKGNRENDK